MGRIHLLNQFVWPDAAPTSIYSEQLADELVALGESVCLVGTNGHYRQLDRPAPRSELTRLPIRRFPRHFLPGVFLEYALTARVFRRYLREQVQPGDTVVATSAPPTTPWLIGTIRRRGAKAVYRLHDYYPELARAVWRYPDFVRRGLRRAWDRSLARWDAVLKVGENLGYRGANARVFPDWAPFQFTEAERAAHPVRPGTALYAGNFGYAHDVDRFLPVAEQLRAEGYRLVARGDGPGFRRLPDWIECGPAFPDEAGLRAALLEAEVHLIAAHPDFQEALFPSKVWNSLEAGRRLVSSGFEGVMASELARFQREDHRGHRRAAALAVQAIARG